MICVRFTTPMFGGLLCCWAIIVALLCGADGARVGEGTSTDPTDGYGKGSRSLLIGGRLANASQYPYYVQAIDPYDGIPCAGALVAPDVFVTKVGACFIFLEPPNHQVLVGSTQSKSNSSAAGGQWRTILADKRDSDLGLTLYKITPVTLPHIQPVQLSADATNPAVGQNLTVIGYNNSIQDGDLLMEAVVQVADPAVCNAMLEDPSPRDLLNNRTQFCTDTPQVGPCFGDEGGPIVDSNGMLVGVTDWSRQELNGGVACDAAVSHASYNRVSNALKWIQNSICELTSNVSAVPFLCPDLVCPPNTVRLNYPTATLPNGKPDVIRIGTRFVNATLTQRPNRGSRLPANSVTAVTMTATNADNETANCTYYVGVPPLEVFATKTITIAAGTKTKRVNLPIRSGKSGPIRFVSAKLSTGKITGRASFIRLSVREPKFGTYTPIPPSITLTKGQPSVSKKAFREAVLHFEDTGPYQVQVTSNITAPRTILLTLYGQDEDGVIFPGRKL